VTDGEEWDKSALTQLKCAAPALGIYRLTNDLMVRGPVDSYVDNRRATKRTVSVRHIRGKQMQITVVAVMCHALGAISQPVCREEIVVKDDMPMQACFLSQPALAEWKEHSIFRGEQWKIGRIKCVPGDYAPKDRA
jgi:hypothetical protein